MNNNKKPASRSSPSLSEKLLNSKVRSSWTCLLQKNFLFYTAIVSTRFWNFQWAWKIFQFCEWFYKLGQKMFSQKLKITVWILNLIRTLFVLKNKISESSVIGFLENWKGLYTWRTKLPKYLGFQFDFFKTIFYWRQTLFISKLYPQCEMPIFDMFQEF